MPSSHPREWKAAFDAQIFDRHVLLTALRTTLEGGVHKAQCAPCTSANLCVYTIPAWERLPRPFGRPPHVAPVWTTRSRRWRRRHAAAVHRRRVTVTVLPPPPHPGSDSIRHVTQVRWVASAHLHGRYDRASRGNPPNFLCAVNHEPSTLRRLHSPPPPRPPSRLAPAHPATPPATA